MSKTTRKAVPQAKPTIEDMRDFIAHSAPEDPLMRYMWTGCLQWAIGEPDILTWFREETGNRWTPGRAPIDRMIDEACGSAEAWFRQFIPWFNKNVWGEDAR